MTSVSLSGDNFSSPSRYEYYFLRDSVYEFKLQWKDFKGTSSGIRKLIFAEEFEEGFHSYYFKPQFVVSDLVFGLRLWNCCQRI